MGAVGRRVELNFRGELAIGSFLMGVWSWLRGRTFI